MDNDHKTEQAPTDHQDLDIASILSAAEDAVPAHEAATPQGQADNCGAIANHSTPRRRSDKSIPGPPRLLAKRSRFWEELAISPDSQRAADEANSNQPLEKAPPEKERGRLQHAVEVAIESLQAEEPPHRSHNLKKRELQELQQSLSALDESNRPDLSQRRDALKDLGQSRDPRALALLESSSFADMVEEREAAASALGEFEGPDAAVVLLHLLDDRNESVRRVAVRGLGRCGSGDVVRPLVFLAVGQDSLQREVLLALDSIKEAAIPELVKLVQHDDARVVAIVVTSLGRIGGKAAVRPLLSALEHSELDVRIAAAEGLGTIGNKKAVGPLVRLLASPEDRLRRAVVGALVAMPHPGAVGALRRLLADPVKDIRALTIEALGAIGDARAQRALIGVLERAEDDDAAIPAVRAIGGCPGEDAAPYLIARLELASPELSAVIAEAMGRLRDPRAVPSLLSLIDESKGDVRFAAVTALGRIGHSSAAAGLCERLARDSEVRIRNAAAKALGNLGTSKAARYLEQAARQDSEVRCAAVIALGRLKNPSSMAVLHEMLTDPAPEVRYQATVGLAAIGHQDSVRFLSPLLDDPAPMVRRGADKSLKQLGDTGETWRRKCLRLCRNVGSRLVPDFVFLMLPSHSKGLIVGAGALLLLAAVGAIFWFAGQSGFAAPATRGQVKSVDFSPDGRTLAVARTNGSIEFWNLSEFQLERTVPLRVLTNIVYSEKAGKLIFATQGGPQSWTPGANPPQPAGAASGAPPVECYLSADGKTAACRHFDGSVEFIDVATGRLQRKTTLDRHFRRFVAASPDFKYFASGDAQGKIWLASGETGEVEHDAKVGRGKVQAVAFLPDGSSLVAVMSTGSVMFIPYGGSGEPEEIPSEFTRAVAAIDVSPDGNYVAIASVFGQLALVDREAQSVEFIRGFDADQVDTVAFSPDGKRLAFGGTESSEVWIVDVQSRKVTATLDVAE